MEKKSLIEIDYIRTIAILSIVVWHCFICPYYVWGVVEVESSNWPLIYYSYYLVSAFLFPGTVMPLFTFISGYVFCYLIQQGKYSDFKTFLLNKLNRLLIPFLVIGSLVSLTSYDRSIYDVLYGGGSHLWFCAMLFWCLIFTWLLIKVKVPQYILYIIVVLSGFFCYMGLDFKLPLGIHASILYVGYFIAGYLLYEKRYIIDTLKDYMIWLVLFYLFVVVCMMIGEYLRIQPLFSVASIIRNHIYSILLLSFFYKKQVRNQIVYERIRTFCKYGFGIYVFHEWIAWNFCHFPIVMDFMKQHFLIFPVLNTIWILFASYFLTSVSLKTRIGRYFLL